MGAPDQQVFSYGSLCSKMYVVGTGAFSYVLYNKALKLLAGRQSHAGCTGSENAQSLILGLKAQMECVLPFKWQTISGSSSGSSNEEVPNTVLEVTCTASRAVCEGVLWTH